jgi:tetratricopeptide (TPR) repeat protein
VTTLSEWELLTQGHTEAALQAFRETYRTTSSRGALQNVALALFDLNRFNEAIDLFKTLRENELNDNNTSELTLVDLGISRWCLGDRSGALIDWEASLDTAYADEAGGVLGPTMLWFGATMTGDRVREEKAVKRLRKIWKPRVLTSHAWPGPVAISGFLLGHVDEERFLYEWTQDHPVLEARRRCKAYFWAGVKQREQAIAKEFFRLASADRDAILEPEFFLARWTGTQNFD